MSRSRWISWIYVLIIALMFEVCLVSVGVITWAKWHNYLTIPFLAKVFPTSNSTTQISAIPTAYSSAITAEARENTPIVLPTIVNSSPEKEITPTQTPTVWRSPPPGSIAFVCNDGNFDQICTISVDGNSLTTITHKPASHLYPAWVPDGNMVFYSSNEDGNFEIYALEIAIGVPRQLTTNIGNLYSPAISPNSNRIAFVNESDNQQNIWVMRLDGSNPRAITDSGKDLSPSWSPSGEKIAFISTRDDTKRIYIMSSNGSNLKPVSISNTPKIGNHVDWSPDGEWLVFSGGDDGNRNIYKVRIDGSGLIQLTEGGDNYSPSFSTSGDWITFTSYRDGKNEIYVMQSDGSNVNRVTFESESNWLPSWGLAGP